jgi:hypothetical protein
MGAERPPTAAGSSRTATTSTGSPPGSSTWGSSSPPGASALFGGARRLTRLETVSGRRGRARRRTPPPGSQMTLARGRARRHVARCQWPAPWKLRRRPSAGLALRRAEQHQPRHHVGQDPLRAVIGFRRSPRPPGEPLRKAACRVWPACATRPGSVRAGVIRARLDTAGRGCTCQAPVRPPCPSARHGAHRLRRRPWKRRSASRHGPCNPAPLLAAAG